MDKDIFDQWMAVEIASNSTRQKLIRLFYGVLGFGIGAFTCFLLRG